MERLLAGFSALGWREYLFAAGMAYVLTYIYRVFQRRKESGKNKEKTYVIQTFDKRAIACHFFVAGNNNFVVD